MSFIDSASAFGGGSNVKAPRAWLNLNGSKIPCESARVTRKAKRAADTFAAELLIDVTAQYGMGLAEWADYQPTDVSISMATALDGSDEVVMITGKIDEPRIDWGEMKVSVSGRDKSSSLIEKRRSQRFSNQKSSDIASTIAQDHGLDAAVVDSSDYAGKLYDQDTNFTVLNRTDFEILSDLADREGYRWYVDGSTLYFEPKETDSDTYSVVWVPPGGAAPYGVATVLDLQTFRNMTAAAPQTHNTPSWHHRDKKLYQGKAEAGGVGDALSLDHHYNGRNQDQTDKIARSRLKDAIRHDCNLVVKAPIDLTVDARMKLQLSGTGTIYDQLYDIDQAEFNIGWEEGAEMTIEARIAKSGRDGTDNSGSTSIPQTSTTSSTAGAGSSAAASGGSLPSLTPSGTSGIGRN